MGIVISTSRELASGAGYYGLSALVACDTNEKTVIQIKDSGYRDTNIQVFFWWINNFGRSCRWFYKYFSNKIK